MLILELLVAGAVVSTAIKVGVVVIGVRKVRSHRRQRTAQVASALANEMTGPAMNQVGTEADR